MLTRSTRTVTSADGPQRQARGARGHGAPVRCIAQDRSEYIIRFQNTGTDTAFTVVLVDTLMPT
ncbi:MAG: hypothetical protein IPN62_17730 [Flavobacteriales bacterium]|nr:hypothetical protein [Flavobacteriales bacterium]